jgi:hypothetical protein
MIERDRARGTGGRLATKGLPRSDRWIPRTGKRNRVGRFGEAAVVRRGADGNLAGIRVYNAIKREQVKMCDFL